MSLALGLLAALSAFAQSEFTFSDGGRKTAYQFAENELFSRGAAVESARSSADWAGGQLYTFATTAAVKKVRGAGANRESLAPVFYDKADLPTAASLAALSQADRAKRMETARRLMTAKLLVHMDDTRFAALAATHPVSREKSLLDGWILVTYPDAFSALDAAVWMNQQGGWEFTPVFARQFAKRQALKREVNDTLYLNQWHLNDAAPRNLNMKDTWDAVTGKGINIAVVDDGLEVGHEDLASSSYALSTNYHRNFNEGPPTDPSPLTASESHGTKCAGLAAATGFNNRGVAGVAPEAMMMGLRLIAGASSEDDSATAMAWQPEGILTHVSSNSWGATDDGKASGRDSALKKAGMIQAATKNRGGLGTIIVVSGGNGRGSGDDSSYDEFSSSRYAIGVGAVGNDGTQSSFSENGLNIAISAFGGEFQPPNVTWTTDTSGAEADAAKHENYPGTQAPVNYTDAMNGTSAAAPQVSGAAALMIQANPTLGYRDVKEILIKTANKEGLTGSDTSGFVKNAGGYSFSHSFGAGLLNVSAAVAAAKDWTNLGQLFFAEGAGEGGAIADDATPSVITFDMSASRLRVEHVEITVNVKHANRGDVGFIIESPSGMRAIANNRLPDDGADFSEFTFTSPRFWGETATGTWRIAALDVVSNGVKGTFVDAKIKILGTLP